MTRHGAPAGGPLFRSLPPGFPGKARVARWWLGDRLKARDVVVESRRGDRFLVPSLAEPVGFHLFIDGVYEPMEVNWILGRLAPGDVFVDVGANIGGFTVPAARRVGLGGRVVAIEASPRIARYLERNVALNDLANVSVCRVAADATSCDAVPFYDAAVERFGLGALTPDYGGTAVSVTSAPLDDVLDRLGITRVAALKIDVEGFEARVFQGARKLLRGAHPPAILFEFYDWAERTAATPGDAQRFLRDCGYRIWTLDAWLNQGPPLADCLTQGAGGNLVAIRDDREAIPGRA